LNCYRCPERGYQYDEARGNPYEGLDPGTRWLSLPEDTTCPGCAVRSRDDFELVVDLGSRKAA
jgi:rubredoxin